MKDSNPIANDFLNRLTTIVEENLSNEQFGVSELAGLMNMSRSNLLRKVKKETKLSVSQLISQVRLKYGMEMLRKSSLNVSEVAHEVGFSSTSYFIKCFREYYGYSPGEVGKRDIAGSPDPDPKSGTSGKRRHIILGAIGIIAALAIGLLSYYFLFPSRSAPFEKSIAVLPFKNESSDSSNLYLINGLMEATLNNLQKINDLKVISRTSTEKYRNTAKSIPEMAQELNVNYFVEGSGQKIGDQLLLNIQLIEASSDRHLWAKQYKRESKDIFALQQEIAKNITEEIKAIITPEEQKRIEKNPTEDLIAYDFYLKAKELYNQGGHENLEKSLPYFRKAIEHDNEFALAYADAAIVYYYLDIFQVEKKYREEISSYSDKALLLDSKLANSLVAKAVFYMHKNEFKLAVPYLEKALEYNPNSALVINFLSDVYNNYIPNTTKYLEYALKGVQLDVTAHDSSTTSYNYLHLSNALIQTGFVEEALENINKSLDYNPDNFFSGWVKVFILYARDRNIEQTRKLLIRELRKDTTNLYLVEEVAKVCYLMRDYDSAYYYYKNFITLKENQQLDVFKHENLKIAMVLSEMGFKEKSAEYVKDFKQYADSDQSIYKHMNLAGYYAYKGDAQKAIAHLKLFAEEDNYQYWILLLENDPVVDSIKNLPAFRQVMQDIATKFWTRHNELRISLEEKGLL